MNKISPIIVELLRKRSVTEESEILEFLSDKPQKTYDPFLLRDLEAGVDLILSCIRQNRKICIYGDYDADGVTSISILMQFLSNFNADVFYYIPSRFDEGYGLNREAITVIKELGTDLILTVDCGSVSYDEVEYAKNLGMQVIVTDHHSITDKKADCLLINPKQADCDYPFKFLAGCGVAFKLAQGIQKKAGLPRKTVTDLLDLVAIGTIGDIVPLVDENRTLVKYGMQRIKEGCRPGLEKLIDDISLKKEQIKSDHIAFGIVPHLNAAGRMLDAKIGVELMTERQPKTISTIVLQLIENNRARKRVQEETFEECEKIVRESHLEDLFFIIHCPAAHEGISGIVAGKIKDKYHKPTIILTPSGDGYLKGTGRSIKNINLYTILKEQEDLFEKFGGHAGACGLLMKEENLTIFREVISNYIRKMFEEDGSIFEDETEVDLFLEGREITMELICELNRLAPFGNSNEKPLIGLKNVKLMYSQWMGTDKNHVRFSAVCTDGSVLPCVFFNRAKEYFSLIMGDNPVLLMGSLDIQEWNGQRKIQFIVNDIRCDLAEGINDSN
ncbi:single-stranded-DNA-specific exonuclease RecJ [Clostridium aminobutyricum]|uniref:Single-stranded-DNA-specific exonuclease RecJ n=1 Tax=Clostridium aminobutyricum TaxID=33953 RepID=A0A939D852_CLOAM|nr:single-stranded-DNA-specific exonuclease RecJ [Clostridium aminobutyricum]MBN7772875.1 single-stranded-DNA-specific exonuclease RecJ [Clostridium aminobutyricum]